MRIALVFDGLGVGGIERVGIHYSKLLHKMGHKVYIYNLKPECKEMEKMFSIDSEIFHYKVPRFLLPDYYMLMVKRWRWGKYLYPWVYLGVSIMMYLFRLFHGKREKYDITIAFSGHFRDLTFVAYNFVKGNKKMCWLHGALMEYLVSSCTYGDLYRKIKNLCVLSEDRQESALHLNQYLRDLNIHQLYNPIPLEKEKLDNEVCQKIKKEFGDYLLMVGRFDEDKDQKTVIKARQILQDRYGEAPKVVFVGGGATLDSCKEYVKELGLDRQIFFMGPRNDVQNFYSSAILSIHSSPAEGLPTVLLESMLYGVAIVATDSPPGVTEILKNDRYGMRCAIGDPEDMAEKINIMLKDNEKRLYYIEQGIKRIQDFSYDTISKKLCYIIKELV